MEEVENFVRFAKFVLIVDTEGCHVPRQIAGILFDMDNDQIVQESSTLIPHQMTESMKCRPVYGSVNYERRCSASKTVTQSMLKQSFAMFNQMIDRCDLVLAHGAHHDKKIFAKLPQINFQDKPWFCTIRIPWPGKFSRRLINIASNMNVKVINPHVALADCHMLLACLRKHPDFKTIIQREFPRSMQSIEDMQSEISTDDEKTEGKSNEQVKSPIILGKRKRGLGDDGSDTDNEEYLEPDEFLLSMLDACKNVDGGK